MANPDAVGLTAYRNRELPPGRTRSAHLLAALEEDKTGRQPITFSRSQDLSESRELNSLDNLGHVFLSDPNDSGNTIGYALVDSKDQTAEMTMRPDSFHRVSDLAEGVRSQFGVDRFWAKGRGSAAAGLEASVDRCLTIMTRHVTVTEPVVRVKSGPHIRPFNPTTDTDTWLQTNAEIFTDLPDQASMTRDELASLLKAEWFDPAGFLVAESDLGSESGLIGFHWTKVDPATRFQHRVSGEVFVLGVLAQFAGTGLATSLLDSGLRRISSLGVSNIHLYLEADNKRAHRFYESQGFSDADHDKLLRLNS